MIFGEWNWDVALAVAKEEGAEETWEKARKREEDIFAYLEQGHSLEEAKMAFPVDRK